MLMLGTYSICLRFVALIYKLTRNEHQRQYETNKKRARKTNATSQSQSVSSPSTYSSPYSSSPSPASEVTPASQVPWETIHHQVAPISTQVNLTLQYPSQLEILQVSPTFQNTLSLFFFIKKETKHPTPNPLLDH